jgi:hypothetical protein
MVKKYEAPNATAAALTEIAARAAITDAGVGAVEGAVNYPQPAAAEPELIGRVPERAKSNGPVPRRENVERGLTHFDELEGDNERLKTELTEARERIRLLELQLEQLEGTRNTIESRINQCVLERDQAVREAGELRGALNSVAAICVRYHNAQQD